MLILGYPVIFGYNIYTSFESEITSTTGMVLMPGANEDQLGQHCGVIIGYNNSKSIFIVANSFGPEHGDQGYLYIPYHYVLNPDLTSKYWVIEEVSGSDII